MPRWKSQKWTDNGKPLQGKPPDDHPRRCKHKRRIMRERCRKWAVKGSDFCRTHGGYSQLQMKAPKRYAKLLGPTLQEKIEELSSDPHFDQVSLYDEIAVSRLAAAEALKLAEPVLLGTAQVKNSVKVLALECLKDAMNHVRDMVLAASRIERDTEGKVSLRVVDLIIAQVIRSIHEVCSDEELADKIATHIQESVRLPARSDVKMSGGIVDGVESTPDMMVVEMDDSVCGDEL